VLVQPIDLGLLLARLPAVSAREAAAGRRAAWALAALPRGLTAELGALGAVTLSLAGLAPGDDDADAVVLGLARAGRRGRIVLEHGLARRVVTALLGAAEVPSLRRLGSGERGLLGGVVAAVLDALGADLSVSLAPAARADGSFRLAVDVASPLASGRVVLEVPPEWLRLAADERRWTARAAALTVTAAIEVGVTSLEAGVLAELELGDAVVFDGCAAIEPLPGSRWPARLVLGDHAAAVVVTGDGSVTVGGSFHRTRATAGRIAAEKESAMETVPPASAAAALAAAPIEVVAEVGRLTLRGDEVLGLEPGAVLAFGARTPLVALRVGGELWAEGELVSVDGELGVRVTALHRSSPRGP
jgi:type III secretion system YscQ/HrcQ family protein